MKNTIEFVPLVALDLIIKNNKEEILLGMRTNSPAKNYWFVPGGRVIKYEELKSTLKNISLNELGIELKLTDVKLYGIYDHIYKNENYLENGKFGTHYVVITLIYEDKENKINLTKLPKIQHNKYKFFSIKELLNNNEVHQYTKTYFIEKPNNLFIKID